MVWGNLGAGPNPPQRESNAPASCCSAALISATPGRSLPALRLAVRSSAFTSSAAVWSTLSRWFRQASSMAAISCRKAGLGK